jgi:signal transduction histidine kinase/serine phosphatase RsbU (regulator of sigma subunit)/CheY-like chemotaxis protein
VTAFPADIDAALRMGGALGRTMRSIQWEQTDLGPPDQWPPSLRQALTLMLPSSAQIVILWGPEFIALYNDAYTAAIGDKHPAALARPARESWSEVWDVLEPPLTRVLETGTSFSSPDHPFYVNRFGFVDESYFDVSYDPILTERGEVGGVYCIVNETTERILRSRRLRVLTSIAADHGDHAETVARIPDLLDPADIPFSLLYLESDGALDLVGFAGTTDPPAGVPAAIADVFASGQIGQLSATEVLVRPPESAAERVVVLPLTVGTRPAGALVAGTSRYLKLGDEYLDFLGLVAAQASANLTRRRAFEAQQERVAQFAALDQAKTAFFTSVSHELRTPLTLVLGPLEEALRSGALPTDVRDSLVMAHRNAERLLKQVNAVLDIAGLESGQQAARLVPTDLAAFTADLAGAFEPVSRAAGLHLTVDTPPLGRPVAVDRDMWEKIVLNLLSNAVKFTASGDIAVHLGESDGHVLLEVSDTGAGIAPEELPRLFERFHRVTGGWSRSGGGTGIGLALVRELVHRLGGSVDVESEPGRGTTFSVSVPAGVADMYPQGDHEPSRPTSNVTSYVDEVSAWLDQTPLARSTTDRRDGRILVVDDNADLRRHLAHLLSRQWEVVTAADGEAAWQAVRDEPFDALVADVMMPELGGLGLVERIRSDPRTRTLPILLLSARIGAEATVEGLGVGADDYLGKPFLASELLARVRSNVELGRMRTQTVSQLRALVDASADLASTEWTADVVRVAAEHASRIGGAVGARAAVSGTAAIVGQEGGDGASTAVAVLLRGAEDEPLGEIRVWTRGNALDAEAVLGELARLVELRVVNASRWEAEHAVAATLQRALLPHRLPDVDGVSLAGVYLPGSREIEVGGDWYDAIVTEDRRLCLVVGDVMGKGVPAAALMGQISQALRAYLLEGLRPEEALAGVNRMIADVGDGDFATVVVVEVDPRSGEATFSSAGHPSPLVVDPDGRSRLLHEAALGPPVGFVPHAAYRSQRFRLAPGGRLLLFTDGLFEVRTTPTDERMERLIDLAASPALRIDDLVDAVHEGMVPDGTHDDIALLGLEFDPADRLWLRLRASLTAPAQARMRLRPFLAGIDMGEQEASDITMAVSEAVANAVEHPVDRRDDIITVEVRTDPTVVEARVHDTGHWRAPRYRDAAADRGRGLMLIRAVTSMDLTEESDGTLLTMRYERAPA